MNTQLKNKIIDYWHASRTALCTSDNSRHARMCYVKKSLLAYDRELIEATCLRFGNFSHKELWLNIESAIN